MKTIDQMTEQEILALTDEQVEKIKKLVLAENGVRILDKPKDVELFEIAEPDLVVYNIPLLGDLCFTSRDEAERMLEVIRSSKTIGFTDHDYLADATYFKEGKKRSKWSSSDEVCVETKQAYSLDLYSKVKDFYTQNKKMKEQLAKDMDEYNKAMEQNIELTRHISDRVKGVRRKYARLDEYRRKFNEEYLPLADGDRDMAIRFMVKAYGLTEEEKEYVLAIENEEQVNN